MFLLKFSLIVCTVLINFCIGQFQKEVKFYKNYITNQEFVWDFLKRGSATHAWTSINYCNAKFRVGNCTHQGLDFDRLFQLSNRDKAFFMQLDKNCVMRSQKLAGFLRRSDKNYNFFGIPAVKGPGDSQPVDYDPMQPTFVQASLNLALMFTEGLKSSTGYTKEMLKEMRIYARQYENAKKNPVYVIFDAYYLMLTARNKSIKFEDIMMGANVIIYSIPSQKHAEPHELKLIRNKMRDKVQVILFLGSEMALRMNSYLPTVAWRTVPYKTQWNLVEKEDIIKFLYSPKQLLQMWVPKCRMFRGDWNYRQVIEHLDSRMVILMDFHEYDQFCVFNHTPGNSFVLVKSSQGPNVGSGGAGVSLPPAVHKFVEVAHKVPFTPVEGANFVMGFEEREGPEVYTKEQVDRLIKNIPNAIAGTLMGIRLQSRVIARMPEVDFCSVFEDLLEDQRFRWVFLYPPETIYNGSWPEEKLNKTEIWQLRENIKTLQRETYLIEMEEVRRLLFEDADYKIPGWVLGHGDPTKLPYSKGSYPWPDYNRRVVHSDAAVQGTPWTVWWLLWGGLLRLLR